eukprot:gene2696-5308_t
MRGCVSFKYFSTRATVIKRTIHADGGRDTIEADLKNFLSGSKRGPWNGTKDILVRRGQVPSADYGPKDVIRVCLAALQNNDEPQLDHGACVVLAFKSPNGILAQDSLDPAEYGRFLRSTEYSALVDFASAELIEDLQMTNDNQSARQAVKINGWKNVQGISSESMFDFFLSRTGDNWLIDLSRKYDGTPPENTPTTLSRRGHNDKDKVLAGRLLDRSDDDVASYRRRCLIA